MKTVMLVIMEFPMFRDEGPQGGGATPHARLPGSTMKAENGYLVILESRCFGTKDLRVVGHATLP